MARINLTLDDATMRDLRRHAQMLARPAAGLARELLEEGIRRREAAARRLALARDYAAGRKDARRLLSDLEGAQLDTWDGEDEA